MVTKIFSALIGVLFFSVFSAPVGQDASEKDSERYIAESERQWAESVASGDTVPIERILADDYLGVDTDGSFYDKAKAISSTQESSKVFISNHLNEVKVRFYGETAVAQGSESWVRRTGSPPRGRFVWTDTWIRRNGKWQVVASEDLIAPEPSK